MTKQGMLVLSQIKSGYPLELSQYLIKPETATAVEAKFCGSTKTSE